MNFPAHTILWRRLDVPGHEHARLALERSHWQLTGTALFAHDGQPARLEYLVLCDTQWKTLGGRIKGWMGPAQVDVAIDTDGEGRWRVNGREAPDVIGCLDLDLSFSPSTNLLPIRRLDLPIGGSADVRSAWLIVPELTLAPLHQRYSRLDEHRYKYESPGHDFTAELRVNAAGLVTHYPGLWETEATTSAV